MRLKPTQQADFKDFVLNLKANRPEALHEFIRTVRRCAMVGLNDYRITPQDFEDIVQETVWAVYRKICQPEFHLDVPLEHYINKTLFYKKMDYRRKRAYYQTSMSHFIEEFEMHYEGRIKKTQGFSMLKEDLAETKRAAQILSEFELEILDYLIEEWTPNEIASELGIPAKRVYNAIYRLRKKLKGRLLQNKEIH